MSLLIVVVSIWLLYQILKGLEKGRQRAARVHALRSEGLTHSEAVAAERQEHSAA